MLVLEIYRDVRNEGPLRCAQTSLHKAKLGNLFALVCNFPPFFLYVKNIDHDLTLDLPTAYTLWEKSDKKLIKSIHQLTVF